MFIPRWWPCRIEIFRSNTEVALVIGRLLLHCMNIKILKTKTKVLYTGRFIMISVITHIYNKKTTHLNGTAHSHRKTEKGFLFFFFLTPIDVRCVHHG